MMWSNVPNQSAPWVSYQAEEYQKTNEYIKQQQAKVPQPPVKTQIYKQTSATKQWVVVFWEWAHYSSNIHHVGHFTYTTVTDRSLAKFW